MAEAHSTLSRTSGISKLKARIPDRVIDVYLDDLMAAPSSTLTTLLHALGIQSISDEYLTECASILFDKPRRTREKFEWSTDLRGEIESRMRDVDYLQRFAQ